MKKHKKNGQVASDKKLNRPKKTRTPRKQKKTDEPLSLHKRPVMCPPDQAGRKFLFRFGGFICRALVIWLAAAGLVVFMSNALDFGVADPIPLAVALLTVALVALFRMGSVCRLISVVATGGTAAALMIFNPRLPLDIFHGILSMYNASLDRLYRVGYAGYAQFKVDIPSSASRTELLVTGVCVLTVVISALFTMFLFKRVRLVVPAVLATSILVVILTFNIYSNNIASNLGITLVIISFASVLIMAAYDRTYRGKDLKQYDTELKLFDESDRPVLPPEYVSPRDARLARKKAKAERKADRKLRKKQKGSAEGAAVVEAEAAPVTREAAPPMDKAQKKAARRTMMEQVKKVRKYEWISEQSRIAMGGYAAAAMLTVCFLAISLPSLAVRENFSTIDAIDDKMELARNYVTALLRGDDKELDRFEYMANGENFEPHSTELAHPQYNGTQIFYVTSRYNSTYYLRGWIGTAYEDGAWLAVDENALNYYQRLFGKNSSPSEELKYQFFHYMKSELVDDPGYTENLFSKYQLNKEYGFVNVMVNLRRVNSPSTLTYFPTTFDPRYGVFEGYGNDVELPVTHVNFYDGLYTGRKYHESGLSYSTYTYAPVMTDETWIQRVAALESAYSLQKEVILAQTGYHSDVNGKVTSYLKLDVSTDKETGAAVFKYTYVRDSGTKVWLFRHESFEKVDNQYIVTTPGGTLTLTMGTDGRTVERARYTLPAEEGSVVSVNLAEDYEYTLTDEERDELMSFINTESSYGDFVYQMYADKSDSAIIRDLAQTILKQVHTEEIVTTEEFVPDDPETPEEDSYTNVHRETVNVTVDERLVKMASLKNSSDPKVYEMRDLLVRNVIDYIIDEMGCTYSLEPDLSLVDAELDGVENFLVNTKEGYCVQFASAAALILRELGIPVRYVEGYVADDLKKISRDFVYGGYVLDRQEHAWIEVYFDGVGWIQYETTPVYYTNLYGQDSTVGSTPVAPVFPDENDTPSTPTDPTTDDDDDENDTDETEEVTVDEELVDEEVAKAGMVMLVILVIMGGAVAGIASVISRARAAEDHRRSLAAQVLDTGFGQNTAERDRREISLALTDSVMGLLSYFDLSPGAGEFKDEYADRLAVELTAESKKKSGRSTKSTQELPDLHVVMNGISAEEFGHGMTVAQMRELALFYLYLCKQVRRRIPAAKRFVLRYIRNKI